MTLPPKLVVLIILFVGASPKPVAEETTKLVHILFRHGHRNPTASYPNDPWKDYPWQDGYSALTSKGKEQLFNLGKTLHDRYHFFFKGNVSTNMLYVRSSDKDRCHMSAASFLAGFFPPELHQIWNTDLNWQPIPIHSLPSTLDNLITVTKKCPRYEKAFEEMYNSTWMQEINEKNKELYEYLAAKTGQAVKDINDVEGLFYIMEMEEEKGLEQPEWVKRYYPDPMRAIALQNLESFTSTNYMKKIKGGPILGDMIKNMQAKLNNSLSPDRDVFIYSAHDITLMNVLRTIGLPFHIKSEYAATFILEAHQIKSSSSEAHSPKKDDYELKMFYYNNSATVDPVEMKLDVCGDPCYLAKFVQVTKDVVPDDWEEACNV